jgi:hypothetical protein
VSALREGLSGAHPGSSARRRRQALGSFDFKIPVCGQRGLPAPIRTWHPRMAGRNGSASSDRRTRGSGSTCSSARPDTTRGGRVVAASGVRDYRSPTSSDQPHDGRRSPDSRRRRCMRPSELEVSTRSHGDKSPRTRLERPREPRERKPVCGRAKLGRGRTAMWNRELRRLRG